MKKKVTDRISRSQKNNPWLEGYYPPTLGTGARDFLLWEKEWSTGPHAEDDWVWFKGDNYTEEEVRVFLKFKPWGTKKENEE